MCNPGTQKTDEQLAQEARRHLQGLCAALRALINCGYSVSLVKWEDSPDMKVSPGRLPGEVAIKKEVSL